MTETNDLFEHALFKLKRIADADAVKCKICASDTSLFDVVDFAKVCSTDVYSAGLIAVPVYYRACQRCNFIFTDFFDDFSPSQWSGYVYNQAYKDIDPDYAEVRPQMNARLVDGLLRPRKGSAIGLDYGGGSGRTCELLRGLGYAYDTFDPFGQSWLTAGSMGRYDFCSAFEVAEHTPDPAGFLSAIVTMMDPGKIAILVGTHVHDKNVSSSCRLSWWYAAPRNGHISLYSTKSLQCLAKEFGLSFTGFGPQTHLLTRGYSQREAHRFLLVGKLRGRLSKLLGSRASFF